MKDKSHSRQSCRFFTLVAWRLLFITGENPLLMVVVMLKNIVLKNWEFALPNSVIVFFVFVAVSIEVRCYIWSKLDTICHVPFTRNMEWNTIFWVILASLGKITSIFEEASLNLNLPKGRNPEHLNVGSEKERTLGRCCYQRSQGLQQQR